MSQTITNDLLILARESRGLTQNDLVAKIEGLNQGNYSKMEKGLLGVSEVMLEKIATTLDFPLHYFFETYNQPPIASFYYRKRQSIPKKILSKFEARLNLFRIVLDKLFEDIELPDLQLPVIESESDYSPCQLAGHVRERLGFNRGPLTQLVSKLEEAGVIIYFIDDCPEKFDGIALITEKNIPIIVVDATIPNDRKHFTIAHELGHLVMHIFNKQRNPACDVEKEANEFAGELLMPENEVYEDLVDLKYSKLSHLKEYWKVSKAALIFRANSLGTIDENRYKSLYFDLSRYQERKTEKGFVQIEAPRFINEIIGYYENNAEYTLLELLEFLSISKEDYLGFFKNSKFRRLATPKSKVFPLKAYSMSSN